MVHRADVSSSVMQDKVWVLFAGARDGNHTTNQLACQPTACNHPTTLRMQGLKEELMCALEANHPPTNFSTVHLTQMKGLEEERLRALEAAARARAEVQELSESRRKLQWQSKLLEKMSEVRPARIKQQGG